MYATGGSAVVHPPEVFNLPDLMFEMQHIDKHSGFGQGDALVVFCWLKTPNGYAFVPAGGIGDNPKGVAFRKTEFAGFPAEENYHLREKRCASDSRTWQYIICRLDYTNYAFRSLYSSSCNLANRRVWRCQNKRIHNCDAFGI